jgi:alpha-galactosidase
MRQRSFALVWSLACCISASLALAQDAALTPAAREAAILTPPAPQTPRINGPHIYGERSGRPFLYHVPATGKRPMKFSAERLPPGLALDGASGLITGRAGAAGTYPVKITATNDLGRDTITLKVVIGDTIALTPPMGWNSWNFFARRIDDAKMRAAADAMVASGLADHGWTYVNVDDCWQGQRDANGNIHSNEKFPDMQAMADYIHSKGLKFGTYSSPGSTTCAGFTASYHHESQDVQTYAKWGVDYVKYDWCSYSRIAPERTELLYAQALPQDAEQIKALLEERKKLPGGGLARGGAGPARGNRAGAATNPATNPAARRGRGPQLTPEQQAKAQEINARLTEIHNHLDADKQKQIQLQVLQEPYKLLGDLLNKADRDIVYSLCQYGNGNVWEWGDSVGGNSWRTTGDIRAQWASIARIGFGQAGHEKFAGPGHWNDPDMLEVGNGNLTPDEMYSHFSLWCLLDSPLLIGCDMSRMDRLTTSIFSNDEVIAVSQDELGRQASRLAQADQVEVWAKPMSDGSLAVGLFNRADAEQRCTARWSDLGIAGSRTVRDLWRQRDLGTFDANFTTTVRPHGVMLLEIAAK